MGTPETKQLWLRDQWIINMFILEFTLSVQIFSLESPHYCSCRLCGTLIAGRQESSPPAEDTDAAQWKARQGVLHLALSLLSLMRRDHVSVVRHSVPHCTLCVCTHTSSQPCSLHFSFSGLGCTNQIPNIGLCFSNHCLKRRKVARRNDPYHRDGACYGIYKWHSQDE